VVDGVDDADRSESADTDLSDGAVAFSADVALRLWLAMIRRATATSSSNAMKPANGSFCGERPAAVDERVVGMLTLWSAVDVSDCWFLLVF